MRKTKVKYGSRRHQSRWRFKIADNSYNPWNVFADIQLSSQDDYFMPPITGFQLFMINQFMDNTDQV